eukprot:305159_1
MATQYSLSALLFTVIPLALSLSTPYGEVTILCADTTNPDCCRGEGCAYLDFVGDAAPLAVPIAVLPQAPPPLDCTTGIYVNCLIAPCSRSSCPSYPDAICTNDQCNGCTARWSLSGIQLSQQECFAFVAPPTPKPTTVIPPTPALVHPTFSSATVLPVISPCTVGYLYCGYTPCVKHTCTAYPAATCSNDFCGGCNAIFRKQNGDILTESECFGAPPPELVQPEVVLKTPQPQLPAVLPQATQSGVNTGCAAGFVNCLVKPCSVNSCPLHRAATCTDNNCGGCNAVFSDEFGNELTKEQCGWTTTTTPQPVTPTLISTTTTTTTPQPTTPAPITTTTTTPQPTTPAPITTTTTTTTPAPVTPQRPPCIIGFASCTFNPCDRSQCVAHPDATCTNDYCGGCHAKWSDTNGNELSVQQCAPLNYRDTTTTSTTLAPPIEITPAEILTPQLDTTTTTTTTTRAPPVETTKATRLPQIATCALGFMYCNPEPCEVNQCAIAASCTNNNCGGCYAIFKDLNGQVLTPTQCKTTTTTPAPTTTTTTTPAPVTAAPTTTTTPAPITAAPTTTTTTTPAPVTAAPTTTTLPLLVQPEIIPDPVPVDVSLPPKVQPETTTSTTSTTSTTNPPEIIPVEVVILNPPEIIPEVQPETTTSTTGTTSTTLSVEAPTCAAIGEPCTSALPEDERCCLHSGVSECLFDLGLFKGADEIGRCCIKHRKKGCTVDSDCCRIDGICSSGKCKKDRSILVAAAARDVENEFDNFEMVNDTKGQNFMTISVSTVTIIFIVVLLVIPMGYYWYYRKCILKKLKQEVRREVFHGLEVSAHSDNEFEDSSDNEFID